MRTLSALLVAVLIWAAGLFAFADRVKNWERGAPDRRAGAGNRQHNRGGGEGQSKAERQRTGGAHAAR